MLSNLGLNYRLLTEAKLSLKSVEFSQYTFLGRYGTVTFLKL